MVFSCVLMLTVAESAESLLKLTDIMSAWMPQTVCYFMSSLSFLSVLHLIDK